MRNVYINEGIIMKKRKDYMVEGMIVGLVVAGFVNTFLDSIGLMAYGCLGIGMLVGMIIGMFIHRK